MNREILFKAKRKNWKELPKEEWWVEGYLFDDGMPEPKHYFIGGIIVKPYEGTACDKWNVVGIDFCEIDINTLCQYTGLTDKNGKKIWENDILIGHGNDKDLSKVSFGKFYVIDAETLRRIDEVIGWHTEVIETDALSKCEPFCLPMPLTDFYIERSEFEVCGNIFDGGLNDGKEAKEN